MLRGSIPLGRIAGIRVFAHWSVVATLALLTWILAETLSSENISDNKAVIWVIAFVGAAGLMVSLLAHEFAHSIVARHHGVQVDQITLWLLGGISELGDEPSDPKSDLRIALAGPATSAAIGLTSLAIAVATAAVAPEFAGHVVVVVFGWIAAMNLMLAVFNLLPGAPLDGGRVVRAVVWRRTGDRLRGAAAAARGGRGIGLALILIGCAELLVLRSAAGLWLMLLGWFLRSAANAELTNAVTRHQLGSAAIRDIMTDQPLAVSSEMAIADFVRSSAPRTAHRVFPVVDADGRPVGALSMADLVRSAPANEPGATVGSRARRLPRGATIDQNALLTDVLSRVILRPGLDLIAATDEHGRLAGIVTASDLANACDRSALGLPLNRTPGMGRISERPLPTREPGVLTATTRSDGTHPTTKE